ncbi:MAG: cytochrome-c peroxidase [Pirellulaceae bacterium]
MRSGTPLWSLGLCVILLSVVVLTTGCQPSPSPRAISSNTTSAPDIPCEPADDDAAEGFEVPAGLPALEVPEDNAMTPAKVKLGKLLFFDKRLSGDNTLNCASCHNPETGWVQPRHNAVGIDGQEGDRNAPTIINAAFYKAHFWDGRAPGLEAQAVGPIQNPIEMGQDLDELVKELSEVPGYVEKFQEVFGTKVTQDGIAKALATFERTILGGNAPYDRFTAGDKTALTEAQQRGWAIFEEAGCNTCHTPPLFSNHTYQNAGVGMDKEKIDEGRKAVTGKEKDLGKFRVPELRNVEKTGPYFHDGSAATLEDAVALMAGGGKDNEHLSPFLKAIREAEIDEQGRKDLVEFLKALTSDYPIVEAPDPL